MRLRYKHYMMAPCQRARGRRRLGCVYHHPSQTTPLTARALDGRCLNRTSPARERVATLGAATPSHGKHPHAVVSHQAIVMTVIEPWGQVVISTVRSPTGYRDVTSPTPAMTAWSL